MLSPMDSDFSRPEPVDGDARPAKASVERHGPDVSREEIGFFFFALKLAQGDLQQRVKPINEQYSLGPRGIWMIGLIGTGMAFPSDLTKMLKIGRSLVTAELNRLTDARLIETRQNDEDGRRLELRLTAEGEAVRRRLGDQLEDVIRSKLSGYTREEILLVTRMLREFGSAAPRSETSLLTLLRTEELLPAD